MTWPKTSSAPRAKCEWLLCIFLENKPWRQKQIRSVGKFEQNDEIMQTVTFFSSAKSLHNQCIIAYFLLV